MALALYRKYRPRTFAEVIGQEHVTEPLTQALRSGRLHHAYLFSGPRGCGKTSSARILARSLNCVKGPTPEPCAECDSCVALAPDGPGSIDVIEIDAASHGGVDDARDLRERAFFAPVASRFKVYVIDEAHMVSPQGFNALLKLVEEPPDFVKFVFATTEPEKVLGTIRSRTHHYPFRLIPPGVLRPYLEKLCREEGVSVEPAVFPLVVRAGGGSARDSLSVLDQLIAGAGVYGVTYARAVSLLGVTDVALIDEMTDALAAGDGATAFATIDRVAEAGHDPRHYAADLLQRLRDLIILQRVPDAAETGIIEAPADQLERMTAQAARMGPATVSRMADIAHNGLTEMRGTTAPRLLLELIVARMLLPGADDAHGALLQRLERMERRLGAATTEAGSDPAAAMPAAPTRGAAMPAARSAPASRPADETEPALTGPALTGPALTKPAVAEPGLTEPGLTEPATTEPATTEPATTEPATTEPAPPPPAAPDTPAAPPPRSGRARSAPAGRKRADASPAAALAERAPPPIDAPSTPGPAGPPGSLDAAAVRRVWDEVLTVVRRRSPRAWAVVREAMVRDVHGEEIVLVFQHAVHANMFGAQAELLVEAVREVIGGAWRFRAELGGEQAARAAVPDERLPGAAQPPAREPDGDWPATARPGGAEPAERNPAERNPAERNPAERNPAERNPAASEPTGTRRPATRPAAASSGAVPARQARANRAGGTETRAGTVEPGTVEPGTVEPGTVEPGTVEPGTKEQASDEASQEQASEEQALRLLSEHLGAEPIGEPPSRT